MSDANWWASKLNGTVQPSAPTRSDNLVPMPPSQRPMAPMPTFQPTQAPTPPSSRQSQSCPQCFSSNFMVLERPAQATFMRCYDCGYPVAEQAGSKYGSLAGASVEGATRDALGNDATSNWNPQGIIGRIN